MPDVIQVSHDSVRFDLGHVSKTCHAEANGQLIRGLLVTLRSMANLSRWGQWPTYQRPTCHVVDNEQVVTMRPMANLSRWGLLVILRPTCHVEANGQLVGGLLVTLRSTCRIEANFTPTAQVSSLNIVYSQSAAFGSYLRGLPAGAYTATYRHNFWVFLYIVRFCAHVICSHWNSKKNFSVIQHKMIRIYFIILSKRKHSTNKQRIYWKYCQKKYKLLKQKGNMLI